MIVRFLFAALLVCLPARADSAPRPNVVFILTDNHGAWTLGCYGNRDIRTPNIDRLASEGTLFTRCYSSNPVCSPTRATYLTGLLPSQHGVHCYLSANEAQIGPRAYCTIAEFSNLPRVLADAGYVCGLSGKWHLGGNERPQVGFTDWLTMPHGGTSTFYNAEVIVGGKIRKEPTYLTDFWTEHAVQFIEQNKDRPFFLYLAYNGPYGLGPLLKRRARNRHADYYDSLPMKSFPREKMHPWLFNNKEYLNNVDAMRRYAAELSGVDDGVGRVLDALRKNSLDERTLVVFTGDQGWIGGQHGIWGMGDHTRPLTVFDGEMQVPLIYRQPGKIPPGKRSDLLVSNYDFLPTVLDYVGLQDKTPVKPRLPGHSYAPVLRGEPIESRNAVFFEFENTRAIRTADWKYVSRFPNGPDELYHLKADPDERVNLIESETDAEARNELARRAEEFFNQYADPKYDLRHGGGSKTALLTGAGN
ncbi:MAG TPA: sulfatase-like hydrolase/transferase [Pirellulales bacterium]